jgi:hypothetical protein
MRRILAYLAGLTGSPPTRWDRRKPTNSMANLFTTSLIARGGSTSRHADTLKNVAISKMTMLARATVGAATMHFAYAYTVPQTTRATT